MNDLSKQQLILLALLVSFVTSLATGIVTVSLMDQSPAMGQTITQVIEKTIEQVAPQDAAVGTASMTASADPIADSVKKISGSIVKLKSRTNQEIAGIGVVVSPTGVILSNKTSVAGLADYVALLPNGMEVPVVIIQSQIEGDIVFLAPASHPAGVAFNPVTIGDNPSLGQTVLSLSGTSTQSLGQGIVTSLPSGTSTNIGTSINPARLIPGSPLFDENGTVFGIRTDSSTDDSGASFYSLSELRSVIPVLR